MSEQHEASQRQVGRIGWVDLTVDDAPRLRDFYREVVGWTVGECAMGDYSDYFMCEPNSGEQIAGVCHARGPNADLPPTWLLYITVADLDASIERTLALGGEIIAPRRAFGDGAFAVVRDPAGAAVGLFQH
ncbi:MAG: VOC family protein [Pseudomonadota bacterium]